MTTLATSITSTAQTTFSSIPNGVTPATSDNTTKLATTAYVQANKNLLDPALYLTRDTNQTMTGTTGLGFTTAQIIDNIDSINIGDTLQVGETNDNNLTIGQATFSASLFIKTYLQPITNLWKFWANGSVNTTTATGVVVQCKKILSGSFVMSTSTTPVVFSPVFTSKPVVIVSIRSTAGIIGLTQTKWVESVGVGGFSARTAGTSANLVYNWIAIGD